LLFYKPMNRKRKPICDERCIFPFTFISVWTDNDIAISVGKTKMVCKWFMSMGSEILYSRGSKQTNKRKLITLKTSKLAMVKIGIILTNH